MSPTQLKRIAGVVVVLVLAWGAARLLPRGTDRVTAGFRLPRIVEDSIDSIVMATRAESVVVTRAGAGRWTVNGYPAAPSAVTGFVAAFVVPTEPELVAQSASSFTRMGVDSAGAHRVRVVRGTQVRLDLFVSDHGPDFESAFVRRPGDSAVYVVSGGLAALTRRRLEDWRDKTVATVVPDSVREISLERNGHTIVLRRSGGVWRFASGAAADTGAVHTLLERWSTVTADGFPTATQLDSTFRGRVRRRATIRGGGTTLVALEFDSTSGGFWVRRAETGRTAVFRLSRWEGDELVPSDSALRARKP